MQYVPSHKITTCFQQLMKTVKILNALLLSSHGSSQIHSFIIKPSRFINFPQSRTLIINMVTEQVCTKRPTCSSCSKPTRICLCNRLKTPILHNHVAITILQHSLEKKHPLNSAKIATIGLKNVNVVTLSDVNFQARFCIRFLDGMREIDIDRDNLFDEMPSEENLDDCVETSGNDDCVSLLRDSKFVGLNGTNSEVGSGIVEVTSKSCENDVNVTLCCTSKAAVLGSKGIVIDFIIEKHGAISFFNRLSVPPSNKWSLRNFDELVASYVASNGIRKGFVVERLLKKPVEGSDECKESEEYTIAIPPGSVLLFPSEESVNVEDVDFEVKNLIVLDGTWAKAKRMYNENPWLKMLPHVRLDIDKLSLYSEVRHQPRAGYLSTIESIVYALKGVGEDFEGLDSLLDVFESMIGDQRQCKKERLRKESEISASTTQGLRYKL